MLSLIQFSLAKAGDGKCDTHRKQSIDRDWIANASSACEARQIGATMSMSDPDAKIVLKEQADLCAMWHGFSDADEMKQWGEQMEHERLAKLDLKEVTGNEP